jgi:hypothetical protein
MMHVNYTGEMMSVDEILRSIKYSDGRYGGIHLNSHIKRDGFLYTGGDPLSEGDWSFVGFDTDTFVRRFPDITPYDLTHTTVAKYGDEVTVWHHRGNLPRMMVNTVVWNDWVNDPEVGTDGTLAPTLGDRNKLGEGSSGAPIFKSSDMKLVGIFYGIGWQLEPVQKEVYDHFAPIGPIVSLLDRQMGPGGERGITPRRPGLQPGQY